MSGGDGGVREDAEATAVAGGDLGVDPGLRLGQVDEVSEATAKGIEAGLGAGGGRAPGSPCWRRRAWECGALGPLNPMPRVQGVAAGCRGHEWWGA